MVQPRVDWTNWLENQLKTLPTTKPVFVALHHPIYSADTFHSGSTYMEEVLEAACEAADRKPEMVLAGHVHNYQGITHIEADGAQTPHLVTGAGGYPNLHSMIKVDGEILVAPAQFDDKGRRPRNGRGVFRRSPRLYAA